MLPINCCARLYKRRARVNCMPVRVMRADISCTLRGLGNVKLFHRQQLGESSEPGYILSSRSRQLFTLAKNSDAFVYRIQLGLTDCLYKVTLEHLASFKM